MPRRLIDYGLRELNSRIPTSARQAGDILNQQLGIQIPGLTTPTREPQRGYMWEVEFVNPMDSAGYTSTFYAKQTAVPTDIVENIKRYYQGVEYSYPSRNTSPRIFRITFWDDDNLTNYRFFQGWINTTSYGPYQYTAYPETYEREVRLKLKDTTGSQTRTTMIMHNARPTELGEATLSYDQSGLFEFDVLFYFTYKEVV